MERPIRRTWVVDSAYLDGGFFRHPREVSDILASYC
jgi:hypothetical protein